MQIGGPVGAKVGDGPLGQSWPPLSRSRSALAGVSCESAECGRGRVKMIWIRRLRHQDHDGDEPFTSSDFAEEGVELNGHRQSLGK